MRDPLWESGGRKMTHRFGGRRAQPRERGSLGLVNEEEDVLFDPAIGVQFSGDIGASVQDGAYLSDDFGKARVLSTTASAERQTDDPRWKLVDWL